jgi:hypothetical protein
MTWQHWKVPSEQEAASARARVLAAVRMGRANTNAAAEKARANIPKYAKVVGVAWVGGLMFVCGFRRNLPSFYNSDRLAGKRDKCEKTIKILTDFGRLEDGTDQCGVMLVCTATYLNANQ